MGQVRGKVILGSDKLLVYGLTFILDHVFYENCFLNISHYIRKLVFNSFHDKSVFLVTMKFTIFMPT